MSDLALPIDAAAIAANVRAFVRDTCIPAEHRLGRHGIDDPLRAELQAAARAAGVFAPQAPSAYGGLGLDMRGQALVFEEAGYSLLGPPALNCAAPDEGTMHLLDVVANAEQKERYLRPLYAGETRSAFAMSEPPPGAGSDPAMLRTTARSTGDGWVIDGDKRWITGAAGAAFVVCMARTDELIEHDRGATMFIVEAGTQGMELTRVLETVDGSFAGGHAELRFSDCLVPESAVLGEVGLGYRYAQVRLAPARLTHCMRWLGLARRALDIALDYTAAREAFGERIDQLGLAQGLIAESVIDLEASRGLIRRGAELLDAGERASGASSVAKVFVAEAVDRVIDRCIQLCGGMGVCDELPLARFAAEVRPFRIYDGPSEVHRYAIARRAVREREQERDAR